MSTEQKKEHHQTSEAAERLSRGWDSFKQGKIISYRMMAIILLVATAIGVFLYIRAEGKSADSRKWTELEEASSVEALQEYAKKYPNTVPGKVAELHLARYLLGPEGIDALTAREEGRRRKAVENVEKARDMFGKLAEDLKDYPVIKAECYHGAAKAEEALIGITKEGRIDEFRGSVDKLIEWLNKLAEAAPDTPWGKDAKDYAEALKNPAKRDELTRTQVALYKIDTLAPGPGGGPAAPGGIPPFGGVPSIPGGPLAPSGPAPPPGGTTPPSVTPPPVGPPVPPPMPPGGMAPIPPSTAPVTPGGMPSNPTPPKEPMPTAGTTPPAPGTPAPAAPMTPATAPPPAGGTPPAPPAPPPKEPEKK